MTTDEIEQLLRNLHLKKLAEILDAWFAQDPSDEDGDRANIAHVAEIERS